MKTDSFGFWLISAGRLLRAKFEQALGDANISLTPAEARTLVATERHQPVRQTDLAVVLGIEPMTLVNHLDRLESQALIQRTPSLKDRRSKDVSVTDRAKPMLNLIRKELNHTVDQVLTAFTPPEREQLTRLLQRLCYNLNPTMAPETQRQD